MTRPATTVTVPVEPTEAMKIAGVHAIDNVQPNDVSMWVTACWSAMITAAPAAPQAAGVGEKVRDAIDRLEGPGLASNMDPNTKTVRSDDIRTVLSALGPATETILARAFADAVMITAGAAARIIGVDEKTFHALVDGQAIRYVLVGRSTKRYTEADLRAYLMRETELSCRSTNQPRASSRTSPRVSTTGFLQRRAMKLAQN